MKPKIEIKSKDHGWKSMWDRVADLARLRSARVRVGVLSGTSQGETKAQKAGQEASGLTLAELAAILHFGTEDGHIPSRPFLTMTLDAQRDELKQLGSDLMAEVLFGKVTLEQALNAMGAKLAAEVKKTISAGVPPPNAPSTALAKATTGRTRRFFKKTKGLGDALAQVGSLAAVKPLIDTGRLLGAVTWSIAMNGVKK